LSDFFIPLLIILLVLGALLHEDFIFTVIYFLAGAYALSRWWSRKALANIIAQRELPGRLFLAEEALVTLKLRNQGWLPAVWIRLNDSLPVNLSVPNFYRQAISLAPKEDLRLQYKIKGWKRGYYELGPLTLQSGDLFGLAERVAFEGILDHVTVFPKIIPLTQVRLPSRSPIGTLRHREPIFEDPSRVLGKREYISGDSLRRVDWKATATNGRLIVKLFEPSIALDTIILLNLKGSNYDPNTRNTATELAIVVAASLANWVVERKQAVGLISNGFDPLETDLHSSLILPRKGRNHLMRVLETLARLQMTEEREIVDQLVISLPKLPWGTTLVAITGNVNEAFFESLFQARRSGLNVLLVVCGQNAALKETRRRAAQFTIPLVHFLNEIDLDQWR
jgi:uncharacterized protein (DUF58 family)